MTDDSFIREVNEELRSEQVRAVWRRFGPILIGGAVAVVIGTAGFVGYEYWREGKAATSGDQFLSALDLASQNKNDEALNALKTLEAEGAGSYPVLAQLRSATLLEQKKDMAGAVSAFDAVAADSKAPVALRDVAKLRAAYILVDTGSYDDVAKRAEVLSADGNPMRGSAREVLGLAAYKAGRADDARKLFQQNADDAAIPANLRQRANTMLDLMRSTETAAKG
ncbi:tetratricopeptide repeat protein [Pseudochrobactrum sp. sp1633]|uniref:tetratricopeptide repeat protein n=1 Tax=Pseudochrobactrum sp. sp1633 TaxID=3036706 RepID=UPI0025A62E62|nr:tetratricopeptide repeat protein [Pseudochrobactrum sp. sp1633]MDM8345302.1 tetratricopeptide repeat protein [Pseudochrobactrum sp. sp1633]HWD12847.1 tetratricopeptide repeat protein [Pseudochrobactrum sp.]